ncbi:MAG: hypothetical protein IJ437_03670 [Clostridia bacterium]|nr:hypothetical protein [Clostridia bacterium]
MKYYIDSNKRITKKKAILTALISFVIVFVLSALIFFFVDKMIGASLLGFFLFLLVVISLICLLAGDNNVVMPYAEIIEQDIVFFNQKSIEQKRIPLSVICSAEITTAYRYKMHTIPKRTKHKLLFAFGAMIFGPKYIVFYDVDFNFLFGLYLCKENYHAFKKYLPQTQRNINFS